MTRRGFDVPGGGPFGLGTGPLAGLYRPVTAADAAATLQAAWAGGVRLFDTAPLYGNGLGERRLGAFLRQHPRGAFTVSTKVGRVLVPGRAPPGEDGYLADRRDDTGLRPVRDYSAEGVRRSLSDSLERTGLDRFDLVLIHDPDEHWAEAAGQAYPALAALRDEGVIGAIGVGMNQWQLPLRFVEETDVDAVLVAGRYTVLDRSAAAELLPACAARGVAVIAAAVLNSGLLADPVPGAPFNYAPAPPDVLALAQRLREVCRSYGVALTAAALRFPARHPAVTATLVGARSAAEVEQNLALAATDIPEALWAALDEVVGA